VESSPLDSVELLPGVWYRKLRSSILRQLGQCYRGVEVFLVEEVVTCCLLSEWRRLKVLVSGWLHRVDVEYVFGFKFSQDRVLPGWVDQNVLP
jgi:hypothetical protein